MKGALISFAFPLGTTHTEIAEAIAAHFGEQVPVNIHGAPDMALDVTGDTPPLRDASAVFTGTPLPAGAAAPVDDIDKEGIPWDGRIHSETKAKTDKGVWRARRGVQPVVTAQVKAELLNKRSSNTPAEASLPVVDTGKQAKLAYAEEQAALQCGPKPFDDATFAGLRSGKAIQVPQYAYDWFVKWEDAFNAALEAFGKTPEVTLAASDPATPAATVHAGLDPAGFPSFAVDSANWQSSGKLTAEQLNATIAQLGLIDPKTGTGSMMLLSSAPQMIAPVRAMLGAMYGV